MRTNEERIAALHNRTAALKREKKNRDFAVICAAGATVCIAVLIWISALIPRASENGMLENNSGSMAASIFTGSSVLGYIVIAILAFLLGISVTVFCFRLKKWLDEKDREEE